MGDQGYLSLSIFHYESLPNGEVMDKIDKWLTIDELAGYIKMSRTKLYGMAQRGEIPASKIGTQWRFDREEIDQWMKAHATGKGGARE
jgi:PTS system nitrogen regulatory IIA component